MDYSLPGSSVRGISQENILEWVAISFSRGSSQPRDQAHISWIGRQILYRWGTREPLTVHFILVILVSNDTIVTSCTVCLLSEGSSWSNKEMTPYNLKKSCPLVMKSINSTFNGTRQALGIAASIHAFNKHLNAYCIPRIVITAGETDTGPALMELFLKLEETSNTLTK